MLYAGFPVDAPSFAQMLSPTRVSQENRNNVSEATVLFKVITAFEDAFVTVENVEEVVV